MQYREYGKSGVRLSVIGLGGHEFHGDGKVKGYQDDPRRATLRGTIMPGFGGEDRKAVVKRALELGINFFDLTIDSEKEAMGRILKEMAPSQEIFIQTRPEGMVFRNPEADNHRMKDYGLVKEETARILGLLGRPRLEVLNFGFMKEALREDPEFIDKVGANIARLKKEGLIRFASVDTNSGQTVLEPSIRSGHFDSFFFDFNVFHQVPAETVIPLAVRGGMGVVPRVALAKRRILGIAEEAGIRDQAVMASAAIKWVLRAPGVTSLMVGVASIAQLESNAALADNCEYTPEEREALDRLQAYPPFVEKQKETAALWRISGAAGYP